MGKGSSSVVETEEGKEEEKEGGLGEGKVEGKGETRRKKPPVKKHKHGEHLLLSDDEVEKLGERLGERLHAFLQFFDEKLGSKDYGLKSHYKGALTWGILAFEEFEQRQVELERRRGQNGGGDPTKRLGPAGLPLSEMSHHGQAQAVIGQEWLEEAEARERAAAEAVEEVDGDA